jgi:hypothetical protein
MKEKPLHLVDFVVMVLSLIGISICIGIGIEVIKYLYHVNPIYMAILAFLILSLTVSVYAFFKYTDGKIDSDDR